MRPLRTFSTPFRATQVPRLSTDNAHYVSSNGINTLPRQCRAQNQLDRSSRASASPAADTSGAAAMITATGFGRKIGPRVPPM